MKPRPSTAAGAPRRPASRGALLLLVGALAAGALVRLGCWDDVFTPGGVRLLPDGDPYYHVLRAEQTARDWPHPPWHDPWLDWPSGFQVFWPPLFDQLIATPAVAFGGRAVGREAIAGWAAVLPVVLALLTLAAVAHAARAFLGDGPWPEAALLLALAPAHAAYTALGRADQHALEALLFACMLAPLAALAAGGRVRRSAGAALLLGGLVALAFWTWPGSMVHVALLAAVAAVLHLAAPAGERPAAAGWISAALALAAAILTATLGLLAPPGQLAELGLAGLTGLHVLLVADAALALGLATGLALLAPRAGRMQRALHLLVGAAVAAAALLGPPPLRAAISATLERFLSAQDWYRNVSEFRSLPALVADQGAGTVLRTCGLALLAPLVALPSLRARWRAEPARRAALLALGTAGAATSALYLAKARFGVYAEVPAAILVGMVARDAGAWAARRWRARPRAAGLTARAAVLVAAVAPSVSTAVIGYRGIAGDPEFQGIVEVGEVVARLPPRTGREGILGSWVLGHQLRYLAHRPAVACDFGVEAGPSSMSDMVAFGFATDVAELEQLAARRRVGVIVVENPFLVADAFAAERPAGAPVVITRPAGGGPPALTPAFLELVASRLYFRDGNGAPSAQPLDHWRLVGESSQPTVFRGAPFATYKAFEWVPGATLRITGAVPSAPVVITVPLVTNNGRASHWSAAAEADATGAASVRVPYATGPSGAVRAGKAEVRDGRSRVEVAVPAGAVADGVDVAVALP